MQIKDYEDKLDESELKYFSGTILAIALILAIGLAFTLVMIGLKI